MSLEDTIGYQNEGEACVVCGKGLRRDEALAYMHHEGQRFPICCPLCLEAWEKDPKPYIPATRQTRPPARTSQIGRDAAAHQPSERVRHMRDNLRIAAGFVWIVLRPIAAA